jgi:hypothetical protein
VLFILAPTAFVDPKSFNSHRNFSPFLSLIIWSPWLSLSYARSAENPRLMAAETAAPLPRELGVGLQLGSYRRIAPRTRTGAASLSDKVIDRMALAGQWLALLGQALVRLLQQKAAR